MKQRFYFDTSVFGGAFDKKFDEASLALFDRVHRGDIICVFSDITERELLNAPQRVRDFKEALPKENMEYVIATDEMKMLAAHYVEAQVVGATSLDDCTHIAIATLCHADALASWNFKHIVNRNRIEGYNDVNRRFGYKQLYIYSPIALLDYE